MLRTIYNPQIGSQHVPLVNKDFLHANHPPNAQMILNDNGFTRVINGFTNVLSPNANAPQRVLFWMDLFQHVMLEMMASVLVIYSAVLIPESDLDFLKQYVGSITLFAVLMTLKDSFYFFPDCTPMTTLVMWAASAYTDENKRTDYADIFCRLFGQMLGYALVFGLSWANKDAILDKSLIATSHNKSLYEGVDHVHAINEGVGTMIECICVAFASIPLLGKYNQAPLTPQNADDSAVKSKLEAVPPTDSQLFYFSLSIGVIHYTIEQLFKTTMNPFITILQYTLRENYNFAWPVSLQFLGLAIACIYVYTYRPSQTTLRFLNRVK